MASNRSSRPDPRNRANGGAVTGTRIPPATVAGAPDLPCLVKRMSRLTACNDELGTALDELGGRLAPLLMPAPADAGDSGKAVGYTMTKVGAAIDAEADRVYAATVKVRELLSRLGV